MQELIAELKDPKRAQPYCLLSEEKRAVLKKAGVENCLLLNNYKEWKKTYDVVFVVNITYILKPDYQPDPEYVDLEIECEDYLGVWRTDESAFLPHPFTHLHCLPSLPGFDCFWSDEGDGYKGENVFWVLGLVSNQMAKNKKVYARFLKGE